MLQNCKMLQVRKNVVGPKLFILWQVSTKEKHGSDPKGKEGKSFLCKHYDEKCREEFGVGRQNEM